MAREKIRDESPMRTISPEEQKKQREKEAAARRVEINKSLSAVKDEEKLCAAILQKNDHTCKKCAACDLKPMGGYCKSAVARAAFEDWTGVMPVPHLVGCMYWRAK